MEGHGKREMQLSWQREGERKLKAKSAISQHPSASTRSTSSPASQLHTPAQTFAFPFTLKGLCSQSPLWVWVAGCSLLETSEKSSPPCLPFNARADFVREVPTSCLFSVKEAKGKGAEVVNVNTKVDLALSQGNSSCLQTGTCGFLSCL